MQWLEGILFAAKVITITLPGFLEYAPRSMQLPVDQTAPAEKPTCSACDRKYTTRGALERHLRTHQSSNRYTCSVCQLGFHRRDILVRHEQIHTAGATADVSNSRRRRCAQACDSCRKAKVKCNEGNPCDRCHQTSRTCTYEHQSSRLSRRRGCSGPEATMIQDPSSASIPYALEDPQLHGE